MLELLGGRSVFTATISLSRISFAAPHIAECNQRVQAQTVAVSYCKVFLSLANRCPMTLTACQPGHILLPVQKVAITYKQLDLTDAAEM